MSMQLAHALEDGCWMFADTLHTHPYGYAAARVSTGRCASTRAHHVLVHVRTCLRSEDMGTHIHIRAQGGPAAASGSGANTPGGQPARSVS